MKYIKINKNSLFFSKNIVNLGGISFLSLYDNSLFQSLSIVYPDYDWLPWKFGKCPKNFWENVNNQRKFLDWAGKELGTKDMSDWYKITYEVNKIEFKILRISGSCEIGRNKTFIFIS